MASIRKSKQQSKLVELFSTRFDPILTLISLYLGIAGLRSLFQVSKSFYRLKEHVEKSCFNLNKRLRDFVAYPDMFRSQLGKYDALIYGGFALNFFDFGSWRVPNLDVWMEAGTNAVDFINYIRKYEGYETSSEDSLNGVTVLGRLVLVNSTRPDRNIRVIRTSGTPIHTILNSAYTTASLNFIAWNKAYSVFPKQTLVHHKLYPLRSMDDSFGSVLNKYKKQGWTTRDIIWPELATDQVRTIGGNRRVGDSLSLIMPLDTSSVQQASTPDSVLEYAQFKVYAEESNVLRARPFGVENHVPQIHVQLLKSPALRHGHTASGPWRTYVIERLQRWAWVEIYKLEQAERPLQFANGIPDHSNVSLPEEFSLPETWDFADDQMPLWYQEWERISKAEGYPLFLR